MRIKKIKIFGNGNLGEVTSCVNEFLAKEKELDLNIIDIKFQRAVTDIKDVITCLIYYSEPAEE